MEIQKRAPDILVVFLTPDDQFYDAINYKNEKYFILKSCTKKQILTFMKHKNIMASNKNKRLFVQMFGIFTVLSNFLNSYY